jgi:putative glutamine amidotransferase
MKALIGVTSIPRQARTGFEAVIPHETIPEMYLDLVRVAGAIPVILPVHADFEPEVVERLDGVLLTGGGDVDPAAYRQERAPTTDGVDRQRDFFELDLARAAASHDIPMLALCRGMQVLNVALNGTLIQDIAAEMPTAGAHWVPERWNNAVHPVRFAPGSLLARILGEEVAVNSLHHQAPGQLGDGLAAAGWSPDGLVEAVEMPGRHFLVGVQWHPECLGPGNASFRLFQSFADAAREVRT